MSGKQESNSENWGIKAKDSGKKLSYQHLHMFLIHDINVINMQFSILVRFLKIIRIINALWKI